MRKLIITASFLALAACGQAKEEAQPAADSPSASASDTAATASDAGSATNPLVGTYEETNPEGKLLTTVIKADGSYTESVEGKVTESGKWSEADGKTCFDPDGAPPARCLSSTPPAADGTFKATNEKGESITVKKVG